MDDVKYKKPLESNPFTALFPSVRKAEEYAQLVDEELRNSSQQADVTLPEEIDEDDNESNGPNETKKLKVGEQSMLDQEKNDLVERIFLITNDIERHGGDRMNDLPRVCVMVSDDDQTPLHMAIEQILFERLLLDDPQSYRVCRHDNTDVPSDETESAEQRPIVYLLQSYNRLAHEEKYVSPQLLPMIKTCRQLIVRNVATSLLSPELFALSEIRHEKIHRQLYNMLVANDCTGVSSPTRRCMYEVADFIVADKSLNLSAAFTPLIDELYEDLKLDELIDPGLSVHMTVLAVLAGHSGLGDLVLDKKYPGQPHPAWVHVGPRTLLDIVLGKSCLIPDGQTREYLFFDDVARMGHAQLENEEYNLQNKTDAFHAQLLKVFRSFLKNEATRSKLLSWIGDFLAQYAFLAKMWTHEHWDILQNTFPPDAVFLNLSSVFVRLCQPFCSEDSAVGSATNEEDQPGSSSEPLPKNEIKKFLKIDPTYILATAEKHVGTKKMRGVHGRDMQKDTCLQSQPEGGDVNVELSPSYKFITECFFFTHRALYLSIHGLISKFKRLSSTLNKLEDTYKAVRDAGADSAAGSIIKTFERGLRIYLSMKAALTEPAFLEACTKLHGTTAQFLTQIAVTDDMSCLVDVVLPLSGDSPQGLFCIPEYVVENITDIVVFLWQFSRRSLYLLDRYIPDFLLMVSIFMGHKSRMSNPHQRASLAKLLEVIMPLKEEGMLIREKEEIFDRFPYAPFLAITTLQLFVDIEFTGDEDQFSQRFRYRQPLYRILRYMWNKENCKEELKECVRASIRNIDDATHPLFLQFTNLLLNDAVYFLDEAMTNLALIKTLERERDNGEWENLSNKDKKEKETQLKQVGMHTSSVNMLSNDSIEALLYLATAEEVRDLFSHPLLCDRIAAMLDDFLLKLVGPKMGALRVRDLSAYHFKPKVLLPNICKIYIDLCEREDFCRAISRDGRSYNQRLFPNAARILRRIGEEDIMQQILEIAERIRLMSDEEEEEEEMYMDAPDEFFDPLVSTLMRDPVILPTSKQVVDRSTISRHLMSDPTDPFIRSPLTMQDVIPHTDLKNQIAAWLEQKKRGKTES